MQNFIIRPRIDLFPGIVVDKSTMITYENDNVKQSIKDLVMETEMTKSGDGYESKMITKIQLEEGDILIFEKDGRGYIKPLEGFCTVADGIDDLENIKDLGER